MLSSDFSSGASLDVGSIWAVGVPVVLLFRQMSSVPADVSNPAGDLVSSVTISWRMSFVLVLVLPFYSWE